MKTYQYVGELSRSTSWLSAHQNGPQIYLSNRCEKLLWWFLGLPERGKWLENITSGHQAGESSLVVVPMLSESVADVVEVHIEAFNGYMNASLGRGYVRAFLSWFCEAQDGISFIARLDGKIVGYVVGAPVGYNAQMTRDLAWVVARSMTCRPWLAWRRDIRAALVARLQLLKGTRRSPKGPTVDPVPRIPQRAIVSLVGIGVADAARGRGVGGALMRAFESEALKRGTGAMRLTVYRDNEAACRVYESAGWAASGLDQGATVCYEKEIGDSHGCGHDAKIR